MTHFENDDGVAATFQLELDAQGFGFALQANMILYRYNKMQPELLIVIEVA